MDEFPENPGTAGDKGIGPATSGAGLIVMGPPTPGEIPEP